MQSKNQQIFKREEISNLIWDKTKSKLKNWKLNTFMKINNSIAAVVVII